MSRTNQTIFGTLGAIFTLCIACFMCGKNLIDAEQGGDRYWTHGCVTGDEVRDEGLVQIGEVTFSPSKVTRPLFVSEHDVRKLAKSDLRGLKATLTSEDGKTVKGEARYDVNTDRGRERGTVKVDAGDGRALVEIKGEDGRELFQLQADEHGVVMNAKDRRGSNLLRLLAGQAGVHLDIKTDGIKAEKEKN